MGRQSFLEPEKWLGRQERKSSYKEPYHVVCKMVLRCFLWQRPENNKLVVPEKEQATIDAVGKARDLPNIHAKINSTSTKHIGDNFTKITIFITCEGSLV